jgi:hypothetical protein
MDRKARIRQYKEAKRPMGVYRVRNTTSGKCLIGATVDLPAMLNRQRFQLESRLHSNRALQQDWNRLGPGAFEFETLDTLEPPDEPGYDPSEDLRMLVAMWLEKLALSSDALYGDEPKRGA